MDRNTSAAKTAETSRSNKHEKMTALTFED